MPLLHFLCSTLFHPEFHFFKTLIILIAVQKASDVCWLYAGFKVLHNTKMFHKLDRLGQLPKLIYVKMSDGKCQHS